MKKLLCSISALALALFPAASYPGQPTPLSMQIDRTPLANGQPAVICANVLSSAPGCMPIGTMSAAGVFTPNLPATGVTAGPQNATANNYLSPVVDLYGRLTGSQSNPITMLLPGGVQMNFSDYIQHHVPVAAYGATCTGGDDTAGLQTAMAAFSTANVGYHLELPDGRFCHFNKPLIFNSNYADFGGVGGKDSGLLVYNGPAVTPGGSNNINLLSVGTGVPQLNGQTAAITSVHDLSITSTTTMLGGAAIYQTNAGKIFYNNIQLIDSDLWNGFVFHQIDFTRLTNFNIATRNECLQVSGNGAENPAGATGPQYDLWVDGGEIKQCHIGVHIGGGFDGAAFDHVQNTTVDYNTVIDETILGDDGKPHPNQEIWLGSQYVQAFANWDNMLINEPLAKPSIFATVSIGGYVTGAGNGDASSTTTTGGRSAQPGIATGSFAGVTPPANSGNGVHIKSYPGGHVHLQMAYAWDFANAYVLTEDNSAVAYQSPSMDVSYAKYGFYSTTPGWTGVKGGTPTMTGVGTAFGNTNTPDITSPYGRLLVGLGAASDPYAQSVISNGGAEAVEMALGTAFGLAANAARELFINRATNTYVDHTMDGNSHHIAVQGQDQVVVTGPSTQIKNSLITNPATPADNGGCTFGQYASDANYIYVCTATNTWKRAALSAY